MEGMHVEMNNRLLFCYNQPIRKILFIYVSTYWAKDPHCRTQNLSMSMAKVSSPIHCTQYFYSRVTAAKNLLMLISLIAD